MQGMAHRDGQVDLPGVHVATVAVAIPVADNANDARAPVAALDIQELRAPVDDVGNQQGSPLSSGRRSTANDDIMGAVGYASSFDTARDSSSPESESGWNSPRWAHRRDQRQRVRRVRPILPVEGLPLSGFEPPEVAPPDAKRPPGRQRLPPGVIRNRIGTWVTNDEGKSAFYVRKAVEVGSFDFDSCG